MSATGFFEFFHLSRFSKPIGDRWLWRQVRRRRPGRIVEFGVGDARRAGLLIRVAQRFATEESVSYTGIDLFEADQKAGGLPLKEAHQLLSATGGKVRLVPGSPASALPGVANSLSQTDLMVISANIDDGDLERAWFYVPRMLAEDSLVVRQEITAVGDSRWHQVEHSQIDELAQAARPRRAA